MTRLRITAVSYLNTIPFIYGIRHAEPLLDAELFLTPPADCAGRIADGLADVALLPVAAIPGIPDIRLLDRFCIGAERNVRTVVLMSDTPVSGIHTVYQDPHSRTSVALVKNLARRLWGIRPVWLDLPDYTRIRPAEGVGYLLIGDKVFDHESRFRFTTDLAAEWNRMTGLPFVFAAWVAKNEVPCEAVHRLEAALEYGVEHVEEAVREDRRMDAREAVRYLTDNIRLRMDDRKKEGLSLFLRMLREADDPPVGNPAPDTLEKNASTIKTGTHDYRLPEIIP